MVVFVRGREFGLPVVMTGVIVVSVVMGRMVMGSVLVLVLVLVLGMIVRVVGKFLRGRFVYRVTHGLSL
jgi:hypothetical protein